MKKPIVKKFHPGIDLYEPAGRGPAVAQYYDSHVHLSDPAYAPYMGLLLHQMERLGIAACCVSVDHASSLATLALARRSGAVLPFLGIHPEMAGGDPGATCGLIEGNAPQISGIGEIGLDPGYGNAAEQAHTFEALLSLAEKLGKPVSIHSRKSLDLVLDTLTSYPRCRALLHWFDGGKRQLARAMDMGLYVSYGPVTVYANDKQSLLARTDPSRLLVETDGPVRFSRCFESAEGHPIHIPSVIFCAAGVLGQTFDETALQVASNTRAFLGI